MHNPKVSRLSRPSSKPSGGRAAKATSFANAHHLRFHNTQFINASQAYISNEGSKGKKILLQNIASSALHNSRERFNAPKCDENTRLEVISNILGWMDDTSTPSGMLCMTGSAGLGKSAIAQTLSETCARKRILAATFFFDAEDHLRNTSICFASTLAYQISRCNGDISHSVFRAVEDDPSIFHQSIETQMDLLLVEPLCSNAPLGNAGADSVTAPPRPHIIIIDGLDKCKELEHQTHILQVLHDRFLRNNLPFKIFLTSRPEHAIRMALRDPTGHLAGVALHVDLNAYDATGDIRSYLKSSLQVIGETSHDPRARHEGWPSDESIETLASNASGQFIYAATMLQFISRRNRSPFSRLQEVLDWAPGTKQREKPFAALDALYSSVLETAQAAYRDVSDHPFAIVLLIRKLDAYRKIRQCHSYITPDTYELEQFLRLERGDIRYMLSDCHSLIKVSYTRSTVYTFIEFYHKSFSDFLADADRSGPFHVPMHVVHSELAVACLFHIDCATESDICNVFYGNDDPCSAVVLRLSLDDWTIHLHLSAPTDEEYGFDGDEQLLDMFCRLSDSGTWAKLTMALENHWTECLASRRWITRVITRWSSSLRLFIHQLSFRKVLKSLERWQVHLDYLTKFLAIIEEYKSQLPANHELDETSPRSCKV